MTKICANVSSDTCSNESLKVCKQCQLVQYCSRNCQTSHWLEHKKSCRSPLVKDSWQPRWLSERRTPAFVGGGIPVQFGRKKYLWGNIPALDVCQLIKNEGMDWSANLEFLFAASGDLRNVVKTVTNIPENFTKGCEYFINDWDIDIVARNIVLLLAAAIFGPTQVEIIVHLWYSAMIPAAALEQLQTKVLPLLNEVSDKINHKSDKVLLRKTWIFERCSITVLLSKAQWKTLPSYLDSLEDVSQTTAGDMRRSVTLAESRIDYQERDQLMLPPYWRVSKQRFRENGILVSHGTPIHKFDRPNPTFWLARDWPMMDSADPLHGWNQDEVLMEAFAKNDLYGGLYSYLSRLLQGFCKRIKSRHTVFKLTNLDARDLTTHLASNEWLGRFDRIEVSNIADRGYMGPQVVLDTVGPMLKSLNINPHATLLMLFMNAVEEVVQYQPSRAAAQICMSKASQYIKLDPSKDLSSRHSQGVIRLTYAQDMFRDFDTIFGKFWIDCDLEVYSQKLGLRAKKDHSIVDKWPYRLRKHATVTDFERHLASGNGGNERYLEWKRVR